MITHRMLEMAYTGGIRLVGMQTYYIEQGSAACATTKLPRNVYPVKVIQVFFY
jgi:hypothetical protein